MTSPRLFEGDKLVIASHNAGKAREMVDLMQPFGVKILSAAELDLPEPEETEATFAGNARLKALAAARVSGLPALADDSGLEVRALDNAPGVYSARWAGPDRDFKSAMRRVLKELEGKSDRRARFVSVLALAYPDGHCDLFEGTVDGTIIGEMRGTNGFGYDPIFRPNGQTLTFGEMEPADKHRMSHRARAFEKLVAACFAGRKASGE